jgi:hypothetical protein
LVAVRCWQAFLTIGQTALRTLFLVFDGAVLQASIVILIIIDSILIVISPTSMLPLTVPVTHLLSQLQQLQEEQPLLPAMPSRTSARLRNPIQKMFPSKASKHRAAVDHHRQPSCL